MNKKTNKWNETETKHVFDYYNLIKSDMYSIFTAIKMTRDNPLVSIL